MKLWSHPDEETRKILEIVLKTKRHNFLEIGCFRFNTTLNFLLSSKEPNLVIGNDKIDQAPGTRELLDKYYGRAFKFVLGDSAKIETQNEIKGILKEKELDILFRACRNRHQCLC